MKLHIVLFIYLAGSVLSATTHTSAHWLNLEIYCTRSLMEPADAPSHPRMPSLGKAAIRKGFASVLTKHRITAVAFSRFIAQPEKGYLAAYYWATNYYRDSKVTPNFPIKILMDAQFAINAGKASLLEAIEAERDVERKLILNRRLNRNQDPDSLLSILFYDQAKVSPEGLRALFSSVIFAAVLAESTDVYLRGGESSLYERDPLMSVHVCHDGFMVRRIQDFKKEWDSTSLSSQQVRSLTEFVAAKRAVPSHFRTYAYDLLLIYHSLALEDAPSFPVYAYVRLLQEMAEKLGPKDG